MNFIAQSAVMHRLICLCVLMMLNLATPAHAHTSVALEHTAPAAVRSFAQTAATNNPARASPEFTMVLALAVDAARTVNLRFDRAYFFDTKRPTQGFAATGTVDDDARATVVWVERAGAFAAVVQLHDKQLQLISERGTSNYAWVEINQHQFKDHPADWHASAEATQPTITDTYKARAEVFKSFATPPAAAVPQAEGDTIIDVMVAYTPAAKAAVGGTAAMDAQINLGVAQTNLAYTNSGVKQQLRLVLAHEIAYAESGNLSTDIATLRTFGDGALDDLHLLRDAYGADIVSLWVENGGGSCGIASVMSTVAASFARSAFNVVTRSCAVGNYSFAHELGHNMGLRHDPFVDTSVLPYPYAHGYVDTANKFRTIMAYNDACAAVNVTCVRVPQFSSATVPYRDWPSGNIGVSNAALALNNTRSTTSVFRNSASANVGGSIQFYPQLVGVSEGGVVTLKVSRLGGSAGAAAVRYQTVEQTARAELDFLTLSGQLTWADGELGDKFIRVQTIQDAQNEGTENFKVELFDFVNAVSLGGSAVAGSTATVEIFDDEPDAFPLNCTLPDQGWSQPEGATTSWGVARDASTEGACSLKSNPLANTGVAAKAQIQFDGVFTGGTIRFDRRVSSEPAFDCLRFFIDGVVVGLSGTCMEVGGVGVSGYSGWAQIEAPITAGNHTLMWSYEKDANTAVGADAAWIDNLSMPLQTQTAPFIVQVSAAGNDVAANVGGTVIAQTLNIQCGKRCSADAVLGGAVKLVAMPNATSIVAGWSVNGVQVCTAVQNPLAAFNGASCTVDAMALNGRTDVLVQFAPRPPRSATIAVLTASKSPSAIGEAFSLRVSLAGTGPAGTVDVRRISAAGVQVICPKVPVLSGLAACDVPLNARPAGLNIYQVYYAGDAANKEVLTTIRHAVGTATNSITLSMEPRTPLRGQTVTLTAQVLVTADDAAPTATSNGKQVAATGSVSFVDGSGNIICEGNPLTPISAGATIAVTSCSFAPQSSATVAQSATARYPQGAVSVNTAAATINYATVAKIAPDYSDMWWAGEPQRGWGMSITQHGNTQFNVLYIYDEAGQPVWLVMPGGTWNTEQTEYSGVVYQPQSSPYYAYKTTPDPNTVLPLNVGKPVGQIKLKFLSQKTANLSYTINGASGTTTGAKNIERQVFGAPSPAPRLPVNDLWWGGTAENGWGLNIAQQGNTLFGVWYTYNAQGETTWRVMPGGTWEGNAYAGALYRTQATAWLGDAYNANFFVPSLVGSLRVEFYDANLGVMTVRVEGEGFAQGRGLARQGF